MSNEDDNLILDQRVLTKLLNFQTVRISRNMTMDADFEIDFNEYRVRLQQQVLAEQLASDIYSNDILVEWPASTWQMFKSAHAESWWFRWFVSRRPVRNRKKTITVDVHVDRYASYPEAAIDLDKLGAMVPVELLKSEIRGE